MSVTPCEINSADNEIISIQESKEFSPLIFFFNLFSKLSNGLYCLHTNLLLVLFEFMWKIPLKAILHRPAKRLKVLDWIAVEE